MTAAVGCSLEPWLDAQATVDASLFDCLQVNLALLAEVLHGPGTSYRLGAALTFEPSPVEPMPTVAPHLDRRLADGAELLGLRVDAIVDPPTGQVLLDHCAPGEYVYVVADAYYLPWTIYYRTLHRNHSFLLIQLGEQVVAFDSYDIDTPAGTARPGHWALSAATVDQMMYDQESASGLVIKGSSLAPLEVFDPRLMRPPEALAVDDYVAGYRDFGDRSIALEQLSLETWLLARSRQLAARWTMSTAMADHAAAWAAYAQETYLTYRRVLRGRPEPSNWPQRLTELLMAEHDVIASLAKGKDPVVGVVLAAASHAFGVDEAQVRVQSSLADLPTFSSFRVVSMIEEIERVLGVELQADDLIAPNLRSVPRLCAALTRLRRSEAS